MEAFASSIRTAVKPGELLFGFITDVHCEAGPDRTGYGATSYDHLLDFARRGRECGAEFLVSGGDLVNGNRPKPQTLRELHAAGEALRSTGLPVYLIIGNHDDNTYFCKAAPSSAADGLSGAEWEKHAYDGCYPAGFVRAAETSNTGFFDLPKHRIRVLILNNVDLPFVPQPDGSLKYYTINDHAFSGAQLRFVAERALDFTGLPDSREWALLVMSHMSLGFLPNGMVMQKILNAFQQGGAYASSPADVELCSSGSGESQNSFPASADPADLVHDVSCDFTRQGPREIIAHVYGHEHLDEVRHGRGFIELSLLNSLCYQNHPFSPERRLDTASEDAQNFLVIDRGTRKIRVFRYGAGKSFEIDFSNASFEA